MLGTSSVAGCDAVSDICADKSGLHMYPCSINTSAAIASVYPRI